MKDNDFIPNFTSKPEAEGNDYSEDEIWDEPISEPKENIPEFKSSRDESKEQDIEIESGDDDSPETISPDAGIEDTTDFYNAHMDQIKAIITNTAKELNPSTYTEQQKYLQDVFELSADRCWAYLEKELAEEKEKIEANLKILDPVTEQEAKDTAIEIATAMFLQYAFESLDIIDLSNWEV